MNFSYHNLEGEIPKEGAFRNASAISVAGNNLPCGGVQELQLPPCPVNLMKHRKSHTLRLVIIIICVVLFVILLAALFAIYWNRKQKKTSSCTSSTKEDLSRVSYRKLRKATSGFSPSNLIGFGSFGSVYKGILDSEQRAVAVKVLNLQKKGASKSFMAECNALRSIRHRNLVKILTCCSSTDYKGNDFKALLFEFMENGSLENWLHMENGLNQPLNFPQRLNIAIDVASALHYLHYECERAIIHCDLKPSNILLDSDMVAHVSDFGLARLLSAANQVHQKQSSTTGLKGTVGYAAPEYGMGGEASKQADVYSFGILLLEMFTGKRPVDDMFTDGFNLRNYVKVALYQSLDDIFDPILLQREAGNAAEDNCNNFYEEIKAERGRTSANQSHRLTDAKVHECLILVFEVGLACCLESHRERITMQVAMQKLHQIRDALRGV